MLYYFTRANHLMNERWQCLYCVVIYRWSGTRPSALWFRRKGTPIGLSLSLYVSSPSARLRIERLFWRDCCRRRLRWRSSWCTRVQYSRPFKKPYLSKSYFVRYANIIFGSCYILWTWIVKSDLFTLDQLSRITNNVYALLVNKSWVESVRVRYNMTFMLYSCGLVKIDLRFVRLARMYRNYC